MTPTPNPAPKDVWGAWNVRSTVKTYIEIKIIGRTWPLKLRTHRSWTRKGIWVAESIVQIHTFTLNWLVVSSSSRTTETTDSRRCTQIQGTGSRTNDPYSGGGAVLTKLDWTWHKSCHKPREHRIEQNYSPRNGEFVSFFNRSNKVFTLEVWKSELIIE